MRGRRRSWLVGGLGLIACGVIHMVRISLLGASGTHAALTIISDVLWAGAVLVLAIGVKREDSVVLRKPLGLTSLVAVALWPLVDTLVARSMASLEVWQVWGYLSILIPIVVGLSAAMQIARARVIPAPWNWAPLWALGIPILARTLHQLAIVMTPTRFVEMFDLFTALGTLSLLVPTLGLGIIAVTLCNRPLTTTVKVFGSSG